MTVYVDALVEYAPPKDGQTRRAGARHGHRWCHMFTDSENLMELRVMAMRIGLKGEWLQQVPGKLPHFDLTPPRRAAAVAFGAVECGRAKLVECIRAARARAMRQLRGHGGPLPEEREPDVVELMGRSQE